MSKEQEREALTDAVGLLLLRLDADVHLNDYGRLECGSKMASCRITEAIEAVRAALASPAAEPVQALTESEERELLDWVSACQSAYHIDTTPGHRFGGFGSNLDDNRDGLVAYVNELLALRASPPATKEAKAGWVDIEDKLPGEQGCDSADVLLFRNGHCALTDFEARAGGAWGIALGYYDADRGCFRVHGRPDSDVSHWMPLPPAPEGAA